ncbi:GNAT family N-acetyltransferase [Streptomyces prasinosporus]|uniref:GNAT family N-acetyltransferase n=1 Tax=Streptomyces prasinosporus TaxID=68256 RepID=A0ABP6UBQ2_9ACTN
MEPVTLTTDRLLLRAVGPQDTGTVYADLPGPRHPALDHDPLPPYLLEHARGFTEQMAPDGWANGSMFTFGVFLPSGDLAGMLGITMRSFGTGEIGFWGTKEHRGNGYVTEAAVAAARWAFTRMSDRPRGVARGGGQPALARGGRTRGLHRRGHPALGDQQQGGAAGLLGGLPAPRPTWGCRRRRRTCRARG